MDVQDDGDEPVGPPPADGSMTVEVGGETRQLPAERDYTGDGLPDAATETPDGRVIVFAATPRTTRAAPRGRTAGPTRPTWWTSRPVG